MVVPTVPGSTKSVKSMARNDHTKKWIVLLKIQDSLLLLFLKKAGCHVFSWETSQKS
jgi:hypothetical protein